MCSIILPITLQQYYQTEHINILCETQFLLKVDFWLHLKLHSGQENCKICIFSLVWEVYFSRVSLKFSISGKNYHPDYLDIVSLQCVLICELSNCSFLRMFYHNDYIDKVSLQYATTCD